VFACFGATVLTAYRNALALLAPRRWNQRGRRALRMSTEATAPATV